MTHNGTTQAKRRQKAKLAGIAIGRGDELLALARIHGWDDAYVRRMACLTDVHPNDLSNALARANAYTEENP